jgi:hypothetical protein
MLLLFQDNTRLQYNLVLLVLHQQEMLLEQGHKEGQEELCGHLSKAWKKEL